MRWREMKGLLGCFPMGPISCKAITGLGNGLVSRREMTGGFPKTEKPTRDDLSSLEFHNGNLGGASTEAFAHLCSAPGGMIFRVAVSN